MTISVDPQNDKSQESSIFASIFVPGEPAYAAGSQKYDLLDGFLKDIILMVTY